VSTAVCVALLMAEHIVKASYFGAWNDDIARAAAQRDAMPGALSAFASPSWTQLAQRLRGTTPRVRVRACRRFHSLLILVLNVSSTSVQHCKAACSLGLLVLCPATCSPLVVHEAPPRRNSVTSLRSGVENLQEQRVWYSRTSRCSPEGLPVAQPSPVGWQSLEAMTGSDSAELAELKSLQLVITRAPAEWTLPTKTDRQFTPTFEVEVRAQLAMRR
jgi:hypothetical protein